MRNRRPSTPEELSASQQPQRIPHLLEQPVLSPPGSPLFFLLLSPFADIQALIACL